MPRTCRRERPQYGQRLFEPARLEQSLRLRDLGRALAEVVEAGPVPAVDGVVRWRRKDLARWLLETFAISLDETTVGRELKALGFAKISARPRHYAQNELAGEAFKKTSPPNWRRSGRGSRKASR